MTYYSKMLTEQCTCSAYQDVMFFMHNPGRARYLRPPYKCESSGPLQDGVTQIVLVRIEKTIDQIYESIKDKDDSGVVQVITTRQSFLFMGECDYNAMTSDDHVDRFIQLIDDNYATMPSSRTH